MDIGASSYKNRSELIGIWPPIVPSFKLLDKDVYLSGVGEFVKVKDGLQNTAKLRTGIDSRNSVSRFLVDLIRVIHCLTPHLHPIPRAYPQLYPRNILWHPIPLCCRDLIVLATKKAHHEYSPHWIAKPYQVDRHHGQIPFWRGNVRCGVIDYFCGCGGFVIDLLQALIWTCPI